MITHFQGDGDANKKQQKKAASQKNAPRGQKNVISRNAGGLNMQNTAQAYMNDQLMGIHAHINQLSTQQIGKKGVTPSQQVNMAKIGSKGLASQEGTFSSPNIKLFLGQTQTQSQQQLPSNFGSQLKMMGSSEQHLNQQYYLDEISGHLLPNQVAQLKQAKQGQSNQRLNFTPLNNIVNHKFVNQGGKLVKTTASKNKSQVNIQPNLSNTQNVHAQSQHQIPMNHGAMLGNLNNRINSQNSRIDQVETQKQQRIQDAYTDEDLAKFLKQTNKSSHNNSTQMQRSASSRQSRRGKAQTTKGQATNIISATMHNEEVHQISQNTMSGKNKTLYTNISLREISQSPEQRNQGQQSKSKVILIAGGTAGVAKKMDDGIAKNLSQERRNTHLKLEQVNSDSQLIDFENQMQLKNYLSQINAGTAHQSDKNSSVLNIKTVQDINIYNNSFIVNSTNGLPPNFQNLNQNARNIIQHQQIIQNVSSGQVANNANTADTKKGLKLRKELTGLSNNLQQARSVSQGRQNN